MMAPTICPRCYMLDDPARDLPCACTRYRLQVTPPELSVADAILIVAAPSHPAGGES